MCGVLTYSVFLSSSCTLRLRIEAGKKKIGIENMRAHAPKIRNPIHQAPTHLGSRGCKFVSGKTKGVMGA